MMAGVATPPGWETFTLGELFEFSNGVNADKSAYGEGIPFVNVLDVITNEALTEQAIPGRIKLPPSLVARYQVRQGDVLLNRTSETQDEVGLTAVYLGDSMVVFGGFVFRARPKTNRLDTSYSKYALRSHQVREQIIARGQGGIRANVGQRDLRTVRLSLPPPREQRSIAGALSDIDDLIRTLTQLIMKKQAVKHGMMHCLITGETRLPGFIGAWGEVRLGDVATMSSGGTPSSGTPRFYGGDVPWVSISDMTNSGKYVRATEKALSQEGLANSAARLYDENVVLYAMYASLGECALPVGRMSSSQAILGILPGSRLDREFLYYYLIELRPKVKDMGQHGAQPNLNAEMVRGFEIQLPPRSEQRAIASVLADADTELDALKVRLKKAKAVKRGMMQQLMTGRTRFPVKEGAA